MLDIFTDNFDFAEKLQEGDRLLHIFNGNDEYTIVDESMPEDEVEEEIRFALRRKHGRNYRYGGYEDVTEFYTEEA